MLNDLDENKSAYMIDIVMNNKYVKSYYLYTCYYENLLDFFGTFFDLHFVLGSEWYGITVL